MDVAVRQDSFYAGVPLFRGFGRLMDPALYVPLPADWTVGIADIVQSTSAIAAKQYKTVNMAGAAVIAAVTNALDHREFPFVFGGDGASFAVPPGDLALAREAMAATAAWVRDDLGLVMRVAMVPVADIRAKGFDVRVARFAPSPDVSYAMFSGGGLGWAEAAIKRGEFAITPAPAGHHSGSLRTCRVVSRKFPPRAASSCRWWSCRQAARAPAPFEAQSKASSRCPRRAPMRAGPCLPEGRACAGRPRDSISSCAPCEKDLQPSAAWFSRAGRCLPIC